MKYLLLLHELLINKNCIKIFAIGNLLRSLSNDYRKNDELQFLGLHFLRAFVVKLFFMKKFNVSQFFFNTFKSTFPTFFNFDDKFLQNSFYWFKKHKTENHLKGQIINL